ncbi:hypothetical protein Kpol_2001p57 [Vanderwaltozyma polyspora DSM 70294]|uniref:Bud site selection protein 5 n=1 Tax=Vanderwaltozyma polyspora (strain ATCC 22028 / DSM 70294 / BCRC 21397 / CBS 2163 / NBRC 10782 / NRRL Y-8283 / UCD 57-17) TaxID=436907 RepID=A7TGT9_VANPO|nr:uncharacterized protein Kpol_2001p57 [Vanderwaltozyma polyspora DSM 70294]EDO18552.1 hypothetical protein Kpol_2001p57 [Vanderwaltozyma polyspora DSM 70294]
MDRLTRDSSISATTPLFMDHESKKFDSISPTKPLDFSRKMVGSGSIRSIGSIPNNNDYQRSGSSSTIATANESFTTAHSFVTDNIQSKTAKDYYQNNNQYTDQQRSKHDFRNLLNTTGSNSSVNRDMNYNNDNDDTTPLVLPRPVMNNEDYDRITPKAGNQSVTSLGTSMSVGETSERLKGLGLYNSRENLNNGSNLVNNQMQSSPVKAIRVSRIINPSQNSIGNGVSSMLPQPTESSEIESSPVKTINDSIGEDSFNFETTTDSMELMTNDSINETSFKDYSSYQESGLVRDSSINSLDEQSFAYLFIVATHSFDPNSLQSAEDASICLPFKKDDVAFVHNVDESGWGEVTLVKNQLRGWVPFNYFSDIIRVNDTPSLKPDDYRYLIDTRKPLEKLLTNSAKFLLNPQDTRLLSLSERTFNINYINSVRDGVKSLLELTNCVSRSNQLVQTQSVVRKARKKLLADWYTLMIKADHYKNTSSEAKIKKLVDLVFEVLRRSFAFFAIWSVEKVKFESSAQSRSPKRLSQDDASSLRSRSSSSSRSRQMYYLNTQPTAIGRLHEIYDILFTYIGLILGRLDLIERNPTGCETLEFIVHQMIILLRELLFISKSCSSILQSKYDDAYENTLDKSLDPLLSLVSQLVSCIKLLVTQTLKENGNSDQSIQIKQDFYNSTENGKQLILIVSNMTSLIATTITGCNNYLRVIGDFKLGSDRRYPDLKKIKITPDKFIEKCSSGLVRKLGRDSLRRSLEVAEDLKPSNKSPKRRVSRYSSIRAGTSHELAFTYEGTQFLKEITPDEPFSKDAVFDKFKLDDSLAFGKLPLPDEGNDLHNREVMQNEIMYSNDGDIIGISFRALVYRLTDEVDKADDYFTSTSLLNFRSFGEVVDLIDLLILRFDTSNKYNLVSHNEKAGNYSSKSSRLKNRRKLVCKIFQTWMESYWNPSTDFEYLSIMINFFNEGVSKYLPLESKILIELAARLLLLHENTGKGISISQINDQLIPRDIVQHKSTSVISDSSSTFSGNSRSSIFSIDEKIIEEYELTHVTAPSNHTSISLPIPVLNLGRSALLSKYNMQDMERLVTIYRFVLNNASLPFSEVYFEAEEDLNVLIKNWNYLLTVDKSTTSNIVHNELNLINLNPLEVAKQLTLIESKLYMSIEPFELVNENYLEKKSNLNVAIHVRMIMNFTNQLSHYVMESILSPEINNNDRVNRLRSWLKIALSVLYFRNYNSVASIMTVLQNHAITRLTFLWDLLDEKDTELYEYLSRIVHPNNNFKVYRNKLKNIMNENLPNGLHAAKSALPCVPFFNLFLQDLTFISEGNSNFRNPDSFRPNKLINIDKYFKVTKTISTVQYFQVAYDVQEDPSLSQRESFFNIPETIDVDTNNITPVPLLQEFILFEFWRVNTLYSKGQDRGYELSLKILERS